MCYAEFLRYHYLKNNIKLSDSHSEQLAEELVEVNYPSPKPCYSTEILLMPCNEKLKYRKVPSVLRYHLLDKHIHTETHSLHLFFFYFPFRNESELRSCNSGTCTDRINEPGFLTILNRNKFLIEPHGALADITFTNFRSDINLNMNYFTQRKNGECSATQQLIASC